MTIFSEIEKNEKRLIERGYSVENKYQVCVGESAYLLKISPMSHLSSKLLEMKYKSYVPNVPVNAAMLVDFLIESDEIHSLYPWIEGEDLQAIMQNLNASEQYQYGLQAGVWLKQLHTIPIDEEVFDWEETFNQKIDKKIEAYEKVKVYYPNGEMFMAFINQYRNLLKNRPLALCHGDFHVGNMMVETHSRQLVVIDFGSIEIGDPMEEFNRLIWNLLASKTFSSGVIEGYFEGREPTTDEWNLIKLYMAVDVLSSISWAVNYGNNQIEVMTQRGDFILDWFYQY